MEKKILITGASGGFGKLTVETLLKSGHKVVGTMRTTTGRNQEVANELTNAGAQLIEMDVTSNQSVEAGVHKAIELLGGLDVVINNAGVGVSGMVEHFTPEDMQKIFDINVVGVQRVNRAALPFLRKQGKGTIIYISSLLGRFTLPFYGVYNASKWALEALAENYRTELSGFGIESCIVEPGGFPTTFNTNLVTPSDDSRNEAYGDFMQAPIAAGQAFGEALEKNKEQRPQKVADALADLLEQPFGERPFRTIVDYMGMGDHIKGYNEKLHAVTNGIYSAFGTQGMLEVKLNS